MARERRPLVAIVGRPNVGKSTLFNRLVGRRAAIVEDAPGVTRDRHYADAMLDGRALTVIDTGGFVPESKEDSLAGAVRLQAQLAVEECELVLFVVDAQGRASPPPTKRWRATCASSREAPADPGGEQGRRAERRPTCWTADFHRPRPRRAARGVGRARARGRLARAADRRAAAARARGPPSRGAGGGPRRPPDPGGDRRAAQRGQVDARQRAPGARAQGRGGARRAHAGVRRGGYHPRPDRLGADPPGPALRAHRHRGHSPQVGDRPEGGAVLGASPR